MKPVVNIDDLALSTQQHGDVFEARMASIGTTIGARKLGYRVTVVPAGKRAWPYHAHMANEEMFFIIEGHGTLRHGDQIYPLRPGDVIAAQPGGVATAHQIINDSDADLKYLCVSTMQEPDIMVYPDSDKFGVFAGSAPGGDKQRRTFSYFGRTENGVDYWDGEGDLGIPESSK